MIYVLSNTEYRALLTAPGKESDWEVLGVQGQKNFLKNEEFFKGIYKKTAMSRLIKEKI